MDADAIVIGAGLAGLVAAAELADAGKRVLLLDQEPEGSLGGQAFWSFGGLFLVDSPEQRRLRIRDSHDLALDDWLGTARFTADDVWPRRWAEAYVAFAAGGKRAWLHGMGVRLFPVVAWAERGGYDALGYGNSVPRFHITWGTGPGLVEPFARRVRAAAADGPIELRFRHRVDGLTRTGGAVDGVRGAVLEASDATRGGPSSRVAVGEFKLHAPAVLIASGGIGADFDLVRQNWPGRMGEPPTDLLSGVPDHVDGRMLSIAERAGARLARMDRMWHYPEGVENWDPIWSRHGIRVLAGPSSLWLDARGERLPVPLFPGYDTLGTLAHLRGTGFEHSWLLLNQRIIRKELALSGSEQNPDLTGRNVRLLLGRAFGRSATGPVEAFKRHGRDFLVADDLETLVARMNELVGEPRIDPVRLRRIVEARDAQATSPYGKDAQIALVRAARAYVGDRLLRTVSPHAILDPAAGPLIAVRLRTLTRKTLGGLETDLAGRVLGSDGEPVPGLWAAGEAAGFGGGGVHGHAALEGTFLGGCLFSGRVAGRSVAGR